MDISRKSRSSPWNHARWSVAVPGRKSVHDFRRPEFLRTNQAFCESFCSKSRHEITSFKDIWTRAWDRLNLEVCYLSVAQPVWCELKSVVVFSLCPGLLPAHVKNSRLFYSYSLVVLLFCMPSRLRATDHSPTCTSSCHKLTEPTESHDSHLTGEMALSKKSHCHEFTSLLVTNPVLHEQKNLIDQPFATVEHLRAWFPKCDPESKENQTTAVKWRRRSRLLLVAFIVAMVVFVTNFVTLLVLYYDKRFQYSNGFVSVFEGSCSASRQLSIVFHIIINVLSSGLLAASNLCMQLSTAPSRAQVDQAHQDDSDYYDIGILSVRNWWKATRASKMLCILLVLSSLPLHFM